jgi:hypothetical protein
MRQQLKLLRVNETLTSGQVPLCANSCQLGASSISCSIETRDSSALASAPQFRRAPTSELKSARAKGEISITSTRSNFSGYRWPIENRRRLVIASEAAAATLIRGITINAPLREIGNPLGLGDFRHPNGRPSSHRRSRRPGFCIPFAGDVIPASLSFSRGCTCR